MNRLELEQIEILRTKLKLKSDVDLKTLPSHMQMHIEDVWVATCFPMNKKEEFLTVVQPLEEVDFRKGVTGLSAYVLTDEELMELFEVVK
jgi:hypothetical protein